MHIPVVCKTCGLPTGHISSIYLEVKKALVKEELRKLDVPAARAALTPDLKLTMKKVLEDLQIREDCCRATITTALDFCDYY